MTAVFVTATVVAVGLIAWQAVVRSQAFLAAQEPSALFEVDEAVEFVASALPAEVSARLSYEDVEALLGWQLVYLAGREGEGEVDIADDRVVADLVARAEADGREVTAGDVRAVLDAEAAYLAAVGALDPPGK
jgi:hypothetical protein